MIELVADRLVLVDGGLAQEFNGTLEDYTDFVLAKGPSGTPTKTDKKAERRAAAEARERVRTLQSEAAKLEKAPADLTEKRSRIARSEEHTSERQSLMRLSYARFYLKQQKI